VPSESEHGLSSPSGFATPYHFSISRTCGFAFGDAGMCFHVVYIQEEKKKERKKERATNIKRY